MTIWTKSFWLSTLERLVRGAAIGALLYLGDAVLDGQLNALNLNWSELFGFTLGGGLLAVLFSVAGNAYSKNGPSFIKTEQVVPPLPAPAES